MPQTKHEHALLLQRSEISRLEEALEAAEFNAAEEGVEGVVALETQLAVAAAAVAGLRAEVLTRTATLLAESERARERGHGGKALAFTSPPVRAAGAMTRLANTPSPSPRPWPSNHPDARSWCP